MERSSAIYVRSSNSKCNHGSGCFIQIRMDPISDALAAIRVESAGYRRLEATAAWESGSDSDRHACFGMVWRGIAWLSLDGSGPSFNGPTLRSAEGGGVLSS